MIQRAQADNARLLKAFPEGFALDATHHPHISMLQQFVRTADLDKIYAAANKIFASEKPTSWKLKAFKYYYIPSPPVGLAGIVVEPTARLAQTATRTDRSGYAFHGENGDARSVHVHRRRPRHSAVLNRIRRQLCERSRLVKNSIRTVTTWRWHRNLPERDACRAVRSLHVLASAGVGLSAWQFWYGPKGTQDIGPDALAGRPWEKIANARRGPSSGSIQKVISHVF